MQIVGLIGLAYLLALGGTFMRDLKDVLTIFCTAGLYCIPIFYKVEQLPIWAQPIIKSNPFTHLLYCYQDIFVVQALEHPWSWAGVMLSTVLLLNFGYRAFRHSKMLFGNVL
jgi:lipopolysaccharide transport system permease protein